VVQVVANEEDGSILGAETLLGMGLLHAAGAVVVEPNGCLPSLAQLGNAWSEIAIDGPFLDLLDSSKLARAEAILQSLPTHDPRPTTHDRRSDPRPPVRAACCRVGRNDRPQPPVLPHHLVVGGPTPAAALRPADLA
jgi:hypothetical protein